ncbi:AP-4 complex subunit sigma-1 [Reticulomyxa filosa]|uniref:AP complex subunit sigma n=1 Tax=Reticulomyxa filosa TaxID=46433 RepID=X6MYM9_RETFI|nr:AP-4 complex subunit sigma-1 [Reticulomyxa filosa]|eukprot:ETO18594.1 AP-4 complex subunit sigma-1 [Reticulomyxa filosa]
MPIKFILMVNKQGQTRLCQYFEHFTVKERESMEAEVVRKCLARGEHQVLYFCETAPKIIREEGKRRICKKMKDNKAFFNCVCSKYIKKSTKINFNNYLENIKNSAHLLIYRRYASLFFVVGVDNSGKENELSILEFIHTMVETLDKYFENVCELDIMFNIEKAHFILEEMVMNGHIVETNKTNILSTIKLMEKIGN